MKKHVPFFGLIGVSAGILIMAGRPLPVAGQPQPGDVFAEYVWRGPHVNADGWQRVTDPEAGDRRAHVYLPNPVNRLTIEDLQGAIAAEAVIQQWGGHTGTTGKAMRLNGAEWLPVPHPAAIPGDNGRQGIDQPECYQYFTNTRLAVPLEHLQEGQNTLEFTSGDQSCFGFGWGQWGVYGTVIRIYYGPDKPHPIGRIRSPASGDLLGASVLLEAEATSPNGPIESVDFIGHYEDYDYDGDGIWREWHYIYQYKRLRRHLGTATEAPFRALWSTEWVPDQEAPMAVMARIRDESGVYYMTEAVESLALDRRQHSVVMHKPYRVPPQWISRAGRAKSAKVFVPSTLAAKDARALVTTWSGAHADAITFNGETLVPRVGRFHDYGFNAIDVPLHLIQPGTNTFTTFSSTLHHGIEVMWPGFVLFMRFDRPPMASSAPTTDLAIIGEGGAAPWTAITPEDGAVASHRWDDAFEGDQVLRVQPSSSFNALLDLQAPQPQPIAGYKALRLAIHPHELEVKSFHRLNLVIWEQAVPLLRRGVSLRGLDFTRQEWQIVEVPLDSIDFRFPYLETLRFDGRLSGAFLVDDVRLVADMGPTRVAQEQNVKPSSLRFYPNRPNPFNATTVLSFYISRPAQIKLEVYNLSGQKVVALAERFLPQGRYEYRWDGRGADGLPVASGVYWGRLEGLNEVQTVKLMLLQ